MERRTLSKKEEHFPEKKNVYPEKRALMRMEELFSGMLNGFRNAGTLWESWIVFQEQMNCLRETKMDSGNRFFSHR